VVGAVGGVGGFLLPMLLGTLKQLTGSFGPGFLVLALLAFGATFALQRLLVVQMRWRNGWRTPVVARPAEFVTS
jgi:MFS transporter, NNP family, nitrate/nitrite transporter